MREARRSTTPEQREQARAALRSRDGRRTTRIYRFSPGTENVNDRLARELAEVAGELMAGRGVVVRSVGRNVVVRATERQHAETGALLERFGMTER